MRHKANEPIARELLYDALFEDDVFSEIPRLLAESVGARSTSIAWKSGDGDGETIVIANSGYYSSEHYEDYVQNYSNEDPWVNAASHPEAHNRVLSLDDLVSEAEYSSTRFYNDWIKGMGDDAFHCLGVLAAGRHGKGVIGIHRGKGSARFDSDEVAILKEHLPDLRRMLNLRGRLASLELANKREHALLENLPMRVYLVSRNGTLKFANLLAEKPQLPNWLRPDRIGQTRVQHGSLEAAIGKATAPEGPAASTVMVQSHALADAHIVSVVPFKDPSGARLAMLTMATGPRSVSVEEKLRETYGLTAAEAAITMLLGSGVSPARISEERGTSIHTVRFQIKAVTAKLDCRRIAEVATVITRLHATVA